MNEGRMAELEHLAEIGKLSGGFIHDLANHVTVMSLSLDRIENSLLKEGEKIREHAAESARVRKNVTYFIEAVKKHIRGQDIQCYFSPEKKLKELVELFRYKAEKEHVVIHISSTSKAAARETGSLRIYGSRIRFNQLFSNLISNAIDAFESVRSKEKQPEKGHWIKIGIQKNKDAVVISVADNGKGIETKIKDKIFEKFFTTKASGKGLGLGLATVKEIVEKDFSGSISVKSTLGKGSMFSVSIPYRSNQGKQN